MKAWRVFLGDTPMDGCSLIYADTERRARELGAETCPLIERHFAMEFTAWESPRYDDLFNEERVIETNSELPAGVLPFFDLLSFGTRT